MTTVREQAKQEALKKLEGRKSLRDGMTSEQLDFLANYNGPIEVGAVTNAHPHHTSEYVEWMAGVWKENSERQQCNVAFDFLSPHNGEYWYKCTTCGAKDWFARYDLPSSNEPIKGCKNSDL